MKLSILRNLTCWIHPKTFYISTCPVILGTALAFGDGMEHLPSAIATLILAVMIHLLSNLLSQYSQIRKKSNPISDVQPSGQQVRISDVKVLMVLIVLVSIVICFAYIFLVGRGGWPVAIIIIVSIIIGILYTVGPFPLGHLGLGELITLIFCGPLVVAGTYYVQTLEINLAIVIAGFAPGLMSVAIVTLNNIRLMQADKERGKMTLTVRFGRSVSIAIYFFSVLLACLLPIFIHVITQDYIYSLLAVFTLFFAYPAIKILFSNSDNAAWDSLVDYTCQLLLFYTIFFSLGWIL